MRPRPTPVGRRGLLIGALALTAGLAAGRSRAATAPVRLKAIEARAGGRLGLYAREYGGDRIVAWRHTERVLMCSTFKALTVAAVLSRIDRGQARLDVQIVHGPADLLDAAPVTRAHAAEHEMTLEALCAAAIEVSDNAAANLILAEFGGPRLAKAYAKSLGDDVTRLDPAEPALNEPGPPDDPSDTATPAAMAKLWRTLLLDPSLSPASRRRLTAWLEACKTGPDRLMSIVPAGWTLAGRTALGVFAPDARHG